MADLPRNFPGTASVQPGRDLPRVSAAEYRGHGGPEALSGAFGVQLCSGLEGNRVHFFGTLRIDGGGKKATRTSCFLVNYFANPIYARVARSLRELPRMPPHS